MAAADCWAAHCTKTSGRPAVTWTEEQRESMRRTSYGYNRAPAGRVSRETGLLGGRARRVSTVARGHQHSPHYLGREGRQNTLIAHPKIDPARRADVRAATDMDSEEATVRRIVTALLTVAIAIGVATVLVLLTHPHVLTNPGILTTSIPSTT